MANKPDVGLRVLRVIGRTDRNIVEISLDVVSPDGTYRYERVVTDVDLRGKSYEVVQSLLTIKVNAMGYNVVNVSRLKRQVNRYKKFLDKYENS